MFLSVIDKNKGPASRPDAATGAIMAGLVDGLGEPNFEHRALGLIGRLLQVGSWSAYTLQENEPPQFLMASSTGRRDVTGECWRVYQDTGLYRSDSSFDRARSALGGQAGLVLSRTQASELPAAHRAAIYERYQLHERLSIIAPHQQGIITVNLYRYADQPAFTGAQAQAVAVIAPVLVASVLKHKALTPPTTENAWGGALPLLRERYPRLTERELQVCAGLLRGWTFDGIAVHLGVSASTVKTYRDRAFRTLGISHRNQLYAVCAGTGQTH
jgi:DNA-binding NarL/FixJ family response regulator